MRRLKLIGGFAGSTAIAQLALFIAGLLLVRALDKQDYAFYSVCAASLGVISVLSTSGLYSALIAQAGAAIAAGDDPSPAFKGAIHLRWVLTGAILAPILVLTGVLLVMNGASPSLTAAMLAMMFVSVLPTVISGIHRLSLQLHREFCWIQVISVSTAALRLGLTALVFYFAPGALLVFMAANALTAAAESIWLLRISRRHINLGSRTEESGRSTLITAVRRTLPADITVIAAEQFITIALTAAGNTDAIADIAALSRFALLFVVLNGVIGSLISPAVARLGSSRATVVRATVSVSAVYLAFACAFVIAVWMLRVPLLWLLGSGYQHLEIELVVVAAGAAITNFSLNGIGAIVFARGWTRLSWTYIPAVAVWASTCIILLDLTVTLQAIIFAATLSLARLASQVARLADGIRELPRDPSPHSP